MGRKLLITGSILSFIIAALHIVAIFFFMEWSLEYTGVAESFEQYKHLVPGSPYVATALVAAAFAIMGLYGLSGARVIRKFPLLKPAIVVIALAYLLRGILGLAYEMLSQEQLFRGFVFSGIAIFIGICYLYGGLWRWHGLGQGKYFEKESLKTK